MYTLCLKNVIISMGAMAMKVVLHIPQSSSITETSPSNCLVLYPGRREAVGVFYSTSRLSNCSGCNGYRLRKWTQRVQFVDEAVCISHKYNILGKVMHPNIPHPHVFNHLREIYWQGWETYGHCLKLFLKR